MTPDLVQQFLDYMAGERGYSPHTIASYKFDLDQFTKHSTRELLSRTRDDITQYVGSRLEGGLSPRSARRCLAAIRSFYEFLVLECRLKRNPAAAIRAPRAHRAVVRPVQRQEADAMLASIDRSTPEGLRNFALIHVIYGSGLRITEAANLLIADLNWKQGVVKVRQGKGKKDRLVPMNAAEMEALSRWLVDGRPKVLRAEDTGHVFLGWHSARSGKLLTRQRLWQILTGISNAAIGRKASPHKFRHGFVTGLINGGADIRMVQHMAGHTSTATTMVYFHASFERIHAAYTKAHPRGVMQCKKQLTDSCTHCEPKPPVPTPSKDTEKTLNICPDSSEFSSRRPA